MSKWVEAWRGLGRKYGVMKWWEGGRGGRGLKGGKTVDGKKKRLKGRGE